MQCTSNSKPDKRAPSGPVTGRVDRVKPRTKLLDAGHLQWSCTVYTSCHDIGRLSDEEDTGRKQRACTVDLSCRDTMGRVCAARRVTEEETSRLLCTCTVVTRVMTMWAAKFHYPETDIRRLAGGRLKCSTVDTSLRHRAVTMWAAKPAALRVTEE